MLAATLSLPGVPSHLLPGADLPSGVLGAAAIPPPQIVGSTTRGFAGVSGSTTAPLTTGNGDAVLVLAAVHYLRTVTSVHDSIGDLFQLVGSVHTDSVTTLSAWLASGVAASSSLTVGISLSKGAPTVLTVLVVRGVAGSALDAVGPGTTGSSSTSASAPVTAANASDLLILALATTGLPTVAPASAGLSTVIVGHETSGSVRETGAALSAVGSTAGGYVLKATLSVAASWSAFALALRPAATAPPPGCASLPPGFLSDFCTHIQHVVFVVMENHAYDNLYATYCLTASPYCNGTARGMPTGTCVYQVNYAGTGYPAGSCPKGYINTWSYGPKNLTTINPQHSQQSSIQAICGTTYSTSCLVNPPAMTGFWTAERMQYTTFGHYDGSTVPIYWDVAQQFEIGDNFFSSDPSYSLPNHWYMVAGQAPAKSQFFLLTTSSEHTYLNQANSTSTVQDLLNATPGVSWKYYNWALAPYSVAINGPHVEGPGAGSAYAYWSPMAGRAESYTSAYSNHFADRSDLFTNLTQAASPGRGLPAISWVIPGWNSSDHPDANLTQGESFVATVVDAIEESSYWNSTAVFLTWDDYGGFYDHVGPPKLSGLNPLGLSFRMPFVVISPYTPRGAVSHQLGYFDSVLHLIEMRWGMGCVNPSKPTQDCQAPLPSAFFDFANLSSPRAPCLFPTNPNDARYPQTTCLTAAQVGPLDTTAWVGGDDGLSAYEAD